MMKVMIKTSDIPAIKILSAIFSYLTERLSLEVRIDKNEKKQLAVKRTQAIPVNSSIFDVSLIAEILSEVKTIRQKPNKLEEVLRMCCDLLFAIISRLISLSLSFRYNSKIRIQVSNCLLSELKNC
jgi:hypothetical protein